MLNISPSMKFILHGESAHVEYNAEPSKIAPNENFVQLKNGDYYLGYLNEDGLPDGMGIYIYKDNSIYEGFVKNGIKDGVGKFTDAEGKVTMGYWRSDRHIDESQRNVPAKKKGAYRVALEDPHFYIYIGKWEIKPSFEDSPKYEAG